MVPVTSVTLRAAWSLADNVHLYVVWSQLEQYQKQGAVTQDQTALIQRLQGEIDALRADRNSAQNAG